MGFKYDEGLYKPFEGLFKPFDGFHPLRWNSGTTLKTTDSYPMERDPRDYFELRQCKVTLG